MDPKSSPIPSALHPAFDLPDRQSQPRFTEQPKATSARLSKENNAYTFVWPDKTVETRIYSNPAMVSHKPSESEVMQQYLLCETELCESKMWDQLHDRLMKSILPQVGKVENAICLGLGSPTEGLYPQSDDIDSTFPVNEAGNLWRRRSVVRRRRSMAQLALFKAVINLIEDQQNRRPLPAFAQEPRYNTYDRRLHEKLSIRCVDHPQAYCLVTSNSVVMALGAEQHVSIQTLFYNPCIFISGPLMTYWDISDRRWLACDLHEGCETWEDGVSYKYTLATRRTPGEPDDPENRGIQAKVDKSAPAWIAALQHKCRKHFENRAIKTGELRLTFKAGKRCWRVPEVSPCGLPLGGEWIYWRSDEVDPDNYTAAYVDEVSNLMQLQSSR